MMGHAWLKHREALLALVIILMIGAIGSRAPSFVSPGNLVEMFNDTAILIILALGQMMVLLTKGIDLSMAANLALTGMIVALLNAHYPGIPVVALLALAGGGAFAYVKFIKPNRSSVKVSADPDEYDFPDEEYINEDEPAEAETEAEHE